MKATLFVFPYRLMPYEKELMIKEISVLFPDALLSVKKNIVILNAPSIDEKKIERLTYIKSFSIDGAEERPTKQGMLEGESLLKKKQQTRYSTHGIHEYKGKFNPQVIHALANILDPEQKGIFLDPFDGSGTTLLECFHFGVRAVGFDINPLATFIANAKAEAIALDLPRAKKDFLGFLSGVRKNRSIIGDSSREKYLKRWIPISTLNALESILLESEKFCKQEKDFFRVIASSLIRDYSNQEPSDLRIRVRKSPMPTKPFLDAYKEKALFFLKEIGRVQKIIPSRAPSNKAYTIDIRALSPKTASKYSSSFDNAITSPPYLTALPYIDTDRISLVWLKMEDPQRISLLESRLIGSREFSGKEKEQLQKEVKENSAHLPKKLTDIVDSMSESISDQDGFRKRAVPILFYRYFADMKSMFMSVNPLVKKGGKFALIVGCNKTTLGEKQFQIDTPILLADVADECGWKTVGVYSLQTYQRFGLNYKNAINNEALVLLERI